jgi:hypothetical protein
MEFLKVTKKPSSLIAEIVYILLNLGLAIGVLLLVKLFSTNGAVPILAFVLVILSKWRVLAVQPRYWWDNLQGNLLDLLVGLSFVAFIWNANSNHWLQIGLTIGYASWLIFLKPMTSRTAVIIQAAIGQFVAITTLYTIAFTWPSSFVVISMWVIGFISARHTLLAYEEEDTMLLSMIWGLAIAELGWIAHHYTIAYPVISTNLQIPQVAIIITLLSNVALTTLSIHRQHEKIVVKSMIGPLVFALLMTLIMLFFISERTFSS